MGPMGMVNVVLAAPAADVAVQPARTGLADGLAHGAGGLMASGYHEYLLQLVPTWLRARWAAPGWRATAWCSTVWSRGQGRPSGRASCLQRAVDALPLLASERQLGGSPGHRERLAGEAAGGLGDMGLGGHQAGHPRRGAGDGVLLPTRRSTTTCSGPPGQTPSAGWDEFWVVVSGIRG